LHILSRSQYVPDAHLTTSGWLIWTKSQNAFNWTGQCRSVPLSTDIIWVSAYWASVRQWASVLQWALRDIFSVHWHWLFSDLTVSVASVSVQSVLQCAYWWYTNDSFSVFALKLHIPNWSTSEGRRKYVRYWSLAFPPWLHLYFSRTSL